MMAEPLKGGAIALLFLSLILSASSCKRSGTRAGSGDQQVLWPELQRLDEVVYRAEGLARAGDLAALRGSLSGLLDSGKAVTPETTPSNTADPQQVETILSDLASLIDGLSPDIDDETLLPIVLGLHPVVEKLIEAAGMPHSHANEGPNDGFLHPVFDAEGNQVGTAEIKLHDDAGDLEVWLTSGGHGGKAWRQPLGTTLELDFPILGKKVPLAVRDRERNEDESGASTIQDGKTAYFVFPGETGADASWLMGEDFAANAELRFDESTTGGFILRPHIHKD
ncbi:MAG: hypothetical protein AAF514_17755 [Verrucomicrobiota bacterium]